ncbi:MAG: hypothetical protein KF729_30780 [Sandaracinaceae bacterium]|nr:hypothetical protein [Sandaracinaceae bacterium]
MRTGSQAALEREVDDVARALHRRGAVAESIALLRGALARDGSQASSRQLLEAALAGGPLGAPSTTVELGYELVDAWIRRGMLVEALALLGGTALGSREKGREWANLLGELLAPVPVDADDSLRAMYTELVTGGASVALTLLEERERQAPPMPAWAGRRLALLRWMLLDNAEVLDATDGPDATAPSELAAVLGVVLKRGLLAGRAAVSELAARTPADRDAARTLAALDVLVASVEEEAQRVGASTKTMPMVGLTAALLQLRMGNLREAMALLERRADDSPDGARARRLLEEVDVLSRVLEGQPATQDEELSRETTQLGPLFDEPTLDQRLDRQDTSSAHIVLPDDAEPSGRLTLVEIGRGEGRTVEQSSADQQAEALVSEGRLDEAEQVYRGLLALFPHRVEWGRRADELRRQRLRQSAPDGVLVRAIRPIK